jgi:hypothetical protein
VLSEEQRLELWKRDDRFPAWAFTANCESRLEFLQKIANTAKKDGYEILYMDLLGPDSWDFSWPSEHEEVPWTEHLISDATRSAPFLDPDGVPQPVKGYTTWKRLKLDLQPGAEQENTIWECLEQCKHHICCNLGLRVRLVCKKTRDTWLLGPVKKEISSTALYQIIKKSTGKDRLKQQLQNQVLSTDLFCKFLKQNNFD